MHIIKYKGYDIKPPINLPMSYIIVTSGKGGKIPDILNGMYTHPTLAKRDIDKYLDSKPVKDTYNDKAID